LWIAQLDSAGSVTSAKQIGSFEDLSWPVIGQDNSAIYAIQDKNLIKISMNGRVVDVLSSDHKWLKLLGVVQENSILGIVREGNETYPAIFIIDKKQLKVDTSLTNEEAANKSILLQETRTYIGSRKLYVERSERGGRGFDVYYKFNDKVINISDCGDDSSRQPSLSPDYKMILFIKQSRY
jgi:hypothetical protein